MIHAVTSSCRRDLELVAQLHGQLYDHGVFHHVFVEPAELDVFDYAIGSGRVAVRTKPVGGDNGLGRGGAIVRWHCHRQLLTTVADDDTVVHIDSDVYFVDPSMIDELACDVGQIKGYADPNTFTLHDGDSFRHLSGMLIAVRGDCFKRSMGLSLGELWAATERLLAVDLSPSEDVVASYLYQCRGGSRLLTNFHETRPRDMSHRYDSDYVESARQQGSAVIA